MHKPWIKEIFGTPTPPSLRAKFRRAASVLSRWGEGGEGAGKSYGKLGKSFKTINGGY